MRIVDRFLQNAASILETASIAPDSEPADITILIDHQNQLRIVQSNGWDLNALRREYSASTAYSVRRNASAVVVEAQQGDDSCTFRKTLNSNPLAYLGGIPHHLVRSDRA